MDATLTTWCSCNEETQWHYDCTNKNNNNAISINNIDNNNKFINNMPNINNNNSTISNSNNSNNNDTKVTFNHCKANEMRQTHLQRQRDNQQSSTLLLNSEKSAHSSPLPHRLTRRKRLQRQKPTELDDVDFAYAADLEEEDEEDEDLTQQQLQHQKPTTLFTNGQLLGLSRSEQVSTTPHTFTNSKRLQQQHFQHPFDGQPSSLPNNNAYITSTSMLNIHQHHLQNHQLQHQHLHYHLPPHRERRLKHEESFDSSTTTTTNTTDTATSPASPALCRHNFSLLKRDNSTYSDSSSHYSSVDSLLEARKPDPEAILINLGFGPVGSEDILSRIPKRFLKPSQVRGIDTEAFVRRLQLASNLADHSVLGYRGLTGNPDIPPSRIVAKIMQRFEVNERKKSMGSIEQII